MNMFNHPTLQQHLDVLITDAQGIPSALRSSDKVLKDDFKTVLMAYTQAFAAEADAREQARSERNASLGAIRNLFLAAMPEDRSAADNYARALFRTADRFFQLGPIATADDYGKTYEALTGEPLPAGRSKQRDRPVDE